MPIKVIVGKVFLAGLCAILFIGFYYVLQINTLKSTGLLSLSETIKMPEVGMTLKKIRLLEKEGEKVIVDLSASEATINKSSDVVQANDIMVMVAGSEQEPIVVFSNTGTLDRKKGELYLSGDALVRSKNGTVLSSETLFWNMEQEIFSTDDFVVIRGENLLLTGVGMIFDGNSQDITIKNNVSAFVY